MEKNEYKVMYSLEHGHWWYAGLRELVSSAISRADHGKGNLTILDAGCGTGKTLESCSAYEAYGIDFSEEAIKFCRLRKLVNLAMASISDIPFKDGTFDMVISLDVLYHKGVADDLSTLKEFSRVMKKNGILLLNLPAYDFLKSGHDKVIHTKQRYSLSDLKDKVENAGFTIENITYRNTILFPLAFIKRIFERFFSNARNEGSDLKPLSGLLNSFFKKILRIENSLIVSGMRLPFGLSLFCIARKK